MNAEKRMSSTKRITFSEERINTFERDGVVALGQILNDHEVDDLRERLDRHLYNRSGEASHHVRDLSELKGQPLSYSVLQVVDLHKLDHAFDRLIHREDVVDVAEVLLGPNIQLFRDQSFCKPAGHGGEIYMHQDNRYWHLNPPQAITIWIALDDATRENGCVHFIKGSHLWGRVDHVRAVDGRSILLEAVAEKRLAEPIEVPAGHATVHHCQTLHWSPPNRSTRMRRSYTIEYMAAGLLQRGEPCVDHPLLRGRLPESPRPT